MTLLLAVIAIAIAFTASAVVNDTTADRVLGQPDFTHNAPNYPDAIGLNGPQAVALDTSVTPNRAYVADSANNRVLGYSDVTKLANGSAADIVIGQPNFYTPNPNPPPVSASTLWNPTTLAVDGAGNLYIVDSGNHRMLEYDSPFTTDSVADRVFGASDFVTSGQCTVTELCFPFGVAVNTAGNLYVSDQDNRVLEFDNPLVSKQPTRVFGQPDFFSGDPNHGGLSASSMSGPSYLALDSSGDLFVADTGNNRVLEFDSPLTSAVADRVFGQNGTFTTNGCAGPDVGSTCAPAGVAVDSSGNLWVSNQNRVMEFEAPFGANTLASFVLGQGGSFTNTTCNAGGISAGSLCTPSGIAFDGNDDPYVVDSTNNRVLAYTAPATNGADADLVLGQADFTHDTTDNFNGQKLYSSQGIALDMSITPNRLYIADSINNRVLGYSDASAFANGTAADLVLGQPDLLSNASGSGLSNLNHPTVVGVDPAGNVYVGDSGNQRLLRFDSPYTTDRVADWVFRDSTFPGMQQQSGIAFDPAGNLWFTNANTSLVFEFNAPVTKTAPDLKFGVYGAAGVAVDMFGNLYVSSPQTNVFEFDDPLHTGVVPDRVYGTFATNCSPASQTTLCGPSGLATDKFGRLFITDRRNNRVLELDAPLSSRQPTTVFGQSDFFKQGCNRGGVAPSADSLCLPFSVALDSQGNVHIADSRNNRVLKYDESSPSGVRLSPSSKNFGSIALGSTAKQSFVIKNFQAVPLNISNISVSGGDYSQTNTCGSQIAPLAGCSIDVTFTPTVGGVRTGTLSVTDDASGSPQTASLTGTGVPAIGVSPTSLSFGNQQVGTLSAPQNVTVTSNSTATITISGISTTSDYTQTSTCGASLSPGANCVVQVRFSPSGTGSIPGTLSISFAAPGSPATVSLSGKGVTATPTPTSSRTPTRTATRTATATRTPSRTPTQTRTATRTASRTATRTATRTPTRTPSPTATPTPIGPLSASPSVLKFKTKVGATSKIKFVKIKNPKSNSGDASIFSFATEKNSEFKVNGSSTTCRKALPKGKTCKIGVTFTPASIGTQTDTLDIINNASNSPQHVTLTGVGK
ncbi:MAG: choice-of-anchor D domain-containing protein [Candidatus Binatus sp.]|uniref:choice-of-anchor D domain-containing protein n=1 Tax=Candidatus Binatus sp. TaxID=2811406 RepID=UPI0027172E83|nr:choice-of-anchor D domain-containing protein [Candidatus Binatus sp.]MDO8434503.1 choice-of-anchor D domain-containing protein [Candidatus Binatus sp.]